MARTVALTGQKGGSGKSTMAMALAAEALERGLTVLLVDCDQQGTTRTWGALANQLGLPAPTVVSMDGANLAKPQQLPAMLGSFDLAVVDCQPRHSEGMRAALMIADLALLPCGPSAPDAWALVESVELVKTAQRLRRELKGAVAITRKMGNTAIGKGARAALAEVGMPILKSELGFRVAYQEAPAAGLGPAQYAPSSEAADEVRSLTDEVLALVGLTKGKRRK